MPEKRDRFSACDGLRVFRKRAAVARRKNDGSEATPAGEPSVSAHSIRMGVNYLKEADRRPGTRPRAAGSTGRSAVPERSADSHRLLSVSVRSPSGARSLACTLFTFFPIVFFCTLATVRHAAT